MAKHLLPLFNLYVAKAFLARNSKVTLSRENGSSKGRLLMSDRNDNHLLRRRRMVIYLGRWWEEHGGCVGLGHMMLRYHKNVEILRQRQNSSVGLQMNIEINDIRK